MSSINKSVKIIFTLLFLINAVNLNNAECAIFGANVPITSASANETKPKIAIKNGKIWMIWEDTNTADKIINLAVSYNAGEDFVSFVPGNQDVSGASDIRMNPSVAIASDGNSFYAWADDRNINSTSEVGMFDIYMNQTLGSDSFYWTSDIRVSDSTSSQAEIQTSIASSYVNNIDYAYIVWNDDTNGNFDIFFDRYNNATRAFQTKNVKVNDDTRANDQDQPRIAVREVGYTTTHEVFIVWRDTRNQTGTRLSDIYFTEGTDTNGDGLIKETEFTTNVQVNQTLSTSGIYYTAEQPDIDVDNSGNTYVVWRDNRNGTNNYDIYFARKVSTSSSFGTNYKVNDDTGTADQSSPAIAVDKLSGYIYVAWADERDGERNIYSSYSTDGGITWNKNVRVDVDSSGIQDSPDIAVDSNKNVYIVWEDARNGNYDIYFARQLSRDDGTSPTAPSGLTATSSPTKVDLSWNANTEADLAGYNLFRSSTIGGPYTKINGDPIEVLTYSDSGLVGTYYYVLEAVDIAGNHSPFSSEVTANPTFESPGSAGGGCFIATAAFGSPLSNEVQILSQMRDRYLLQSAIGKKLVGFYYKKGPAIADYISDKEGIKSLVRVVLKPLVRICQMLQRHCEEHSDEAI